MNREKMIKTAKALDTLFKVLRKVIVIAMIAAVCVTAVLTVVNWVDPDAVIGDGFECLDLGAVTVSLAPEYAMTNNQVLLITWVTLGLGAVCAGVIWYALGEIRRILAPMKEGDPFRASVSVSIRKIAWVSLALGVLQNIGRAFQTSAVLFFARLEKLAEDGVIRSVTLNYDVDLTFVVVFFVLLLFSYIFRYGEELQTLSDETL